MQIHILITIEVIIYRNYFTHSYFSSLDGPELHQKLSNDIVIRVIVPVIILIILATAAICIFKAVTYEPPKEPPAVEYIYHDYPYSEEGADNE